MKTDIKHRHDCLYDTKVKGCVHYDFECAKSVLEMLSKKGSGTAITGFTDAEWIWASG